MVGWELGGREEAGLGWDRALFVGPHTCKLCYGLRCDIVGISSMLPWVWNCGLLAAI